jgi:hypothetical protein
VPVLREFAILSDVQLDNQMDASEGISWTQEMLLREFPNSLRRSMDGIV